jgi:hypothetical protein
MNPRRALSAVLACAVLLLSSPRGARADESGAPIASTAPYEFRPDALSDVTARPALGLGYRLAATAVPTMTEVRLSHGAKTAIIVTAIVVGALLLVGVIAVSAPHGPF